MAMPALEQVERPVPYDIAAEEAVLGSLLIDRDAIIKVAPFLRSDDFYREAHGLVYQAVLDLYGRREPSDPVTLSAELERNGRLQAVGGLSHLIGLSNRTPTAVHLEYYARIVERTSVLRQLISAGGEIAALGYSEDQEVEQTLDKAEQLLFAVSQRTVSKDFASIEQVLNDYYDRIESIQHNPGGIVGVPSGFHDMDEVTGGLQQSDLIIMAARPGVGKCLPGHTLIDDPLTGERVTLKSYIERKLPVVPGISVLGQVRSTPISDWIDSGIKPTYRVRTQLGREVEVTGHHPFLTAGGWVALHDLKVGDQIAIPRSLPVFGKDESWPPTRVRLLAYLIAEGCISSGSPQFTNADPEIVQDFKFCVAQEFPECAVQLQSGSLIDYRITRPYTKTSRRGVPNPLTVWLRGLGLWGQRAEHKRFPECVWTWSASRLAEFLRVLMSCDGSIYADNKGRPRLEFTVASEQLARDVYHAFVRFGVVARLYKKKEKSWRVQVTGDSQARRYQEAIGWIGEKARRFPQLKVSTMAANTGNVGHPPRATWTLVHQARVAAGMSMIELARRAGETTGYGKYGGYNAHINRSLPRHRLAGYAQVLDRDDLRLLSSSDLFWDTISSIEYAGEQQVYDLTVPDGHNFIAQDVCVHNTSLALGIAHNAAMHDKKVGVFSLEMSREQLVQRLLAVETGVDSQQLRLGYLTDEDWHLVSDAIGRLAQMPIYIDDSAGLNVMEVRSKARRLEAEVGVDMLIVDYLQLMQGTARRDGNRVQEVSEISRGLKMLARELNIPVLACAQLSRAVESRTSHVPVLSDLRESGCLAGETPIYLPDLGVYRPIEQLVGQCGFRVLALNTHTWQLEPRPVARAFATGRKPVYKLSTRLGRSVRATGNHKFLTIHGWQRLDELSPGMRIALPRRVRVQKRDAIVGAGPHRRELKRAWGQKTELGLVILNEVKNLLVGVSVRATDTAAPGSILRRMILRYAQNDKAWWVLSPQQMQAALGSAYCGTGLHKQNVSRERGARLAQVVRSDQLHKLARSDVYWDEIREIEPDGEADVYDLTVGGLHNFVAGDIVSHNSIEQDADIVMFIHREEMYNPETEKKGIAEIHIAKHRNGPLATIPLRFFSRTTKFADLEVYRQEP